MEKLPALIKVFGKLKVEEIAIILKTHCTEETEGGTTITDLLAMKDDIMERQLARKEEAQEKKEQESLTGNNKEQEEHYKFQQYYDALVKQAQAFDQLDQENLCLLWDSKIEAVLTSPNGLKR